MPKTTWLLVAGTAAIAGSPPFALFVSEFLILSGALASEAYLPAALFLILIVIIFAGMTYRLYSMCSGRPQEGLTEGDVGRLRLAPMIALAGVILFLGLFQPEFVTDALDAVVHLFEVMI
jgi:hydrogenase-4 component F